MVEKIDDRFDWRLPLFGAFGATAIFLPEMTFGKDITSFLFMVLAAEVVGLILAILVFRKIRRQSLSILSMSVVFCAISWLLFRTADDVRTNGRWIFQSRAYKSEVLAQSEPAAGELRHVEWDGWGFAGSGDTVVYLVFDPNDSLASAAKGRSPGKFSGIPCEVPLVRRLESHWYTVLFYADTAWDHRS
jgi:hypothetical protein